jgi:hypothetical protein
MLKFTLVFLALVYGFDAIPMNYNQYNLGRNKTHDRHHYNSHRKSGHNHFPRYDQRNAFGQYNQPFGVNPYLASLAYPPTSYYPTAAAYPSSYYPQTNYPNYYPQAIYPSTYSPSYYDRIGNRHHQKSDKSNYKNPINSDNKKKFKIDSIDLPSIDFPSVNLPIINYGNHHKSDKNNTKNSIKTENKKKSAIDSINLPSIDFPSVNLPSINYGNQGYPYASSNLPIIYIHNENINHVPGYLDDTTSIGSFLDISTSGTTGTALD